MKRINLFTGHFGSGKTEIAINFALKLRRQGVEKVSLVDLDIVNPYFCARDLSDDLAKQGIRVISQNKELANAELMTVSPMVLSAFQEKDHLVIFDVGGDDLGAAALGQYNRFFREEAYEMYFVINSRRPWSGDAAAVMACLRSIERASRLRVTSLVSNSNLSDETELADIAEGERLTGEVSRLLGLPRAFTAARRDLAEGAARFVQGEILPLEIFMKPPWR